MKKKGGRPPKYKKKEEFQKIFEEYLQSCKENKQILTKAGLLVFLDIGRDAYADYKIKKEFSDTIRKIENIIENSWLQRLTETGATGAIFYLKNAFKEEYKDRNEMDLTSDGKGIQTIVYLPKPQKIDEKK